MSRFAAIIISLFIKITSKTLNSPNIKLFILGFIACIKLINIPSGPRIVPNKNPVLILRLALHEILRFCNPKIIKFKSTINKGISMNNGANPINNKERIFILVF